MARLHLIEIHEQPWCPKSLRDASTDYLEYAENIGNMYHSTTDLIQKGLDKTGSTEILDLCSGGGGPWLRIAEVFDGVRIRLSDYYPNDAAIERVAIKTGGAVGYLKESVDATRVPDDATGFRTMFTAFHHFRPETARKILEDAVDAGEGIAVFELTQRKPLPILLMLLTPLIVFFATPFIRPFRWSRIAWTYLLPAMLFLTPFDGVVSCLRTYSVEELQGLTQDLDSYEWEIGERKEGSGPIPLTYLLGYPKSVPSAD